MKLNEGKYYMKFRDLIIKNIFRNKTRSVLAILVIAIGAAAILGLGSVTDNLAASTQQALTAGAADFSVVNTTGQQSAQQSGGGGGENVRFAAQTTIDQSVVSQIQQISGVGNAVGVLRAITSLSNTSSSSTGSGNGMINVIGIDPNYISMEDISLTNGTVYSGNNQVIIGSTLAQSLGEGVGGNISLYNQTFTISGIYQTGDFMSDRGVALPLTVLQNLTNNTGQVSLILVKASNGTSATNLEQTVQQHSPSGLNTSSSLSGMTRMNNGIQTIESASWAVTLLALLIGGAMVVATMMKSVSDRTREIGVLKAVGWNKRRILTLIIGESMILAVIATILGLIIGVGAVESLAGAHILNGVQLSFSANLLLRAVGVALFLGIVGGIYPAYRASRLAPTEALRYE